MTGLKCVELLFPSRCLCRFEGQVSSSNGSTCAEDPISRKVAQFYKDTLKIQQLQNAGLQSSIKSLKNELEATRDKQRAEMDNKTSPYDLQTHS